MSTTTPAPSSRRNGHSLWDRAFHPLRRPEGTDFLTEALLGQPPTEFVFGKLRLPQGLARPAVICGAQRNTYTCTRSKEHTGRHASIRWQSRVVRSVWGADQFETRRRAAAARKAARTRQSAVTAIQGAIRARKEFTR